MMPLVKLMTSFKSKLATNLIWQSYEPTVRANTAQVQTEVNRWAAQVVRYKTYVNYLNRVFKFALVMNAVDINSVDRVIIPKKGKPSTRHPKENFWEPLQWEPLQLESFMKFLDDQPILSTSCRLTGQVSY